jgi:hypothetical protein
MGPEEKADAKSKIPLRCPHLPLHIQSESSLIHSDSDSIIIKLFRVTKLVMLLFTGTGWRLMNE